ncbi:Cobyrinic acid ac-diamide synthase [Methylobacterium sp. 4-46]|uniref:ParA family protein n=1 Tax=unclassified Methylobacterium TaxID=2615210 RepID=UPI000152D768|nr:MULTISPECIES: ParA family protein [Methylobacterium]ACA17753.1 Cobyrinic acid ac-diamide synthase [Methylobacterium sp. 4-46]WFT83421.1 ParA family protein [Methylobacterium nodulans]
MQTITIAARKGGVGKATLATHLSVIAAEGEKPVLLFDADPQQSLAWWWQLRPGDTPALVECDARELPRILPAARDEGVAFAIVDTPPHAENSIADAMRVADLVLVPTRPGRFDLAAVATTLEFAQRVGKQPLAVINHAPPRTGAAEPAIVAEARETLTKMGATVAEAVVSQRVAMSRAVIGGQTVNEYEPEGRAAAEMLALWREVKSRLEG